MQHHVNTFVIVICPHIWRREWWRSRHCSECAAVFDLISVIQMRWETKGGVDKLIKALQEEAE